MSVSNAKLYGTIVLWFFITIGLMVAAAYLWVFLYSVFINSSGDQAFYEAYAQQASPVVAVLTAFPVFYMMGRYMCRFGERAFFAAAGVVLLHILMEVGVLASLDATFSYVVGFSIGSAILKVLGAYVGLGPTRVLASG